MKVQIESCKYYFCSIKEHLIGYEFESKFLMRVKPDEDEEIRFNEVQQDFRNSSDILQDAMNIQEISKDEYEDLSRFLVSL